MVRKVGGWVWITYVLKWCIFLKLNRYCNIIIRSSFISSCITNTYTHKWKHSLFRLHGMLSVSLIIWIIRKYFHEFPQYTYESLQWNHDYAKLYWQAHCETIGVAGIANTDIHWPRIITLFKFNSFQTGNCNLHNAKHVAIKSRVEIRDTKKSFTNLTFSVKFKYYDKQVHFPSRSGFIFQCYCPVI